MRKLSQWLSSTNIWRLDGTKSIAELQRELGVGHATNANKGKSTKIRRMKEDKTNIEERGQKCKLKDIFIL